MAAYGCSTVAPGGLQYLVPQIKLPRVAHAATAQYQSLAATARAPQRHLLGDSQHCSSIRYSFHLHYKVSPPRQSPVEILCCPPLQVHCPTLKPQRHLKSIANLAIVKTAASSFPSAAAIKAFRRQDLPEPTALKTPSPTVVKPSTCRADKTEFYLKFRTHQRSRLRGSRSAAADTASTLGLEQE
ncbi:hypothetical protein B0H16DRAFT_1477778 [Mycena metata]|uniref:Uncharacterized protein n=1 Tax=Mycena metata TaxID=1033252 RepID=A0AAD7MFT8_9AGAR|nr:hypothetical protein B0H16DRAFT_1477778 [Mycena metata]